MRKIIILKNCNSYKTGHIVDETKENADFLIKSGYAKDFKEYEDKMMRPRKGKHVHYSTKGI